VSVASGEPDKTQYRKVSQRLIEAPE